MYSVNREKLVKTFVELAEIPSPSWHEKNVMNYIKTRFSMLGAECVTYKCGESANLLIRFKGMQGCNTLLLSGHMDTVIPCEKVKAVVTGTKISSDGTSVLGSDDKAAIAIFIEAFEYIKKHKIEHGPVEILLTCAEELGLKGIKGFDLSILKAKYGFVFDSSGSIGRVIIKAPFHSNMDITVRGKASHAGMAPEKGINAIRVLSEIISALPSGRIDDESTINVGIISGGMATNIVPEYAGCKLEVRSINRKKMSAIEKQVRETAKGICAGNRARCKIERTLEYSGFKVSPDENISRLVASAMKRIKIKPEFVAMGGGSDTNIINSSHIRAINLSCGMQKIHSTGEFVMIKDLVKGTELVLSLVETVK
ncbi:MAG TPA: M20/M25/M40 family metallo-hydrolase [Spirochaetota bacterium]|nr:M20/M25/M40 family metallo-hydrolase [Spirochaetota bacterium]